MFLGQHESPFPGIVIAKRLPGPGFQQAVVLLYRSSECVLNISESLPGKGIPDQPGNFKVDFRLLHLALVGHQPIKAIAHTSVERGVLGV